MLNKLKISLMKRNLLCALIAIPAFSFGQTSILSDNFDTYTGGGTVAAQSAGLWETWSATLPEDAFVSDSVSASGANSMNVYQTGEDAFLHDMVLPFPAVYTTGQYELTMNYFVPVNRGAYFNLGSVWTSGGAGYQYGVDVFFNADGTGYVSTSGTGVFQYGQDEWTAISVMVDLDAGTYELSLNGESIYSGPWGAALGLGVLDVFGLGYTDGSGADVNGPGFFYVDDVELLDWSTSGIDENTLNPIFSVVPNPSNGNFTVNYEELDMASAEIQVVDVLGSVVYSSNAQLVGNGSIDFDLNLNTGVYFVRINDGATVLTERVIVKK